MTYVSVDDMLQKTGQTCKLCSQQIAHITDESKPVRYFKHFHLVGGSTTFTIGRGITKHSSGLCYYHLKKRNGLFNTDWIYQARQELVAKKLREASL